MDQKQKKLIIILSGVAGILLILNIILALMLLSSSPSTPEAVELTYWGFWEDEATMHPILEKYEAENSGVKIKYSLQPLRNYESRVYTRLTQSLETDEPVADIVMIHNSWLPKFESYLSPLPSTIMDRETYAKEFYPTALDDFTGRDEQLYAIPMQIDGLMVIYNKKLLAQAGYTTPPTDWDSFMEAAYILTKRDSTEKISQSGLAIGTARNIIHATDILSYFFLQNKAEIMNEERTAVNLTSERAVIAFDTYTSFASSEQATWAAYLPEDVTLFQRGELAMMFGTTWRALDIIASGAEIEFGLAPMPILPTNEEVYYSTYWAHAVSKTSQNSQEAWKFLKFLSEPEQQRRIHQNSAKTRTFGEPYSRVSMNEELKAEEYTTAIALMAPYMKSWQMGEQEYVDGLLRDAITEVAENERNISSVLRETEEQINEKLAISNK